MKLGIKIALSLALFFVSMAFTIPSVQACVFIPPSAYTSRIENNKYVLVTIWKDPTDLRYDGKAPQVRETYRQPGLYRKDNSSEPIWAMDFEYKGWARFGGQLYTSSDGKYMVSVAESYVYKPLVFVKEGIVIKEYTHQQLQIDTSYPGMCHYRWINEVRFYDDVGVISIKHLNGKKFAFSIYTGEPTTVPFEFDSVLLTWLVVGFVLLSTIWLKQPNRWRFPKLREK
jgi:hypothetical protein